MNTTATPPTLTPITTPPFTASTNTTLISPSPLYSSSTPTATNNVNNDTSLSLLQEILKQLHTLTKPPASTITRLQPVALDADGKQVVCTPPLPQPEPEFQVNTEKLAQLKDAFFGAGTSAELEEFLLMYLETMQICAYEYIELESSVQDLTKNLKDQQIKANKKKKRKRKNLSESSKNLLKKWLADHWFHPYPTNEEKIQLCEQTGITIHSLNHWFINARRRNVLHYALSGNSNEHEAN